MRMLLNSRTLPALIIVALLCIVFPPISNAQGNLPLRQLWDTNGEVLSIATTPNSVYIAGNFDYVGPITGHCAVVDRTLGASITGMDYIAGLVRAAASDGSDGWFIGGDFNFVANHYRGGLAHILSDGTVDVNWVADVDYSVTTIEVSGQYVFVGGSFSEIGGVQRPCLARLEIATGKVTDWGPRVDGSFYPSVESMTVRNNILYIGGDFTEVRPYVQTGIAAIDMESGLAMQWNPALGGTFLEPVRKMVPTEAGLCIIGDFKSVRGLPRTGFACVDYNTALPTSLALTHDGNFLSMASQGNTLYLGGTFRSLQGQKRDYFALLDLNTGEIQPWAPTLNGSVDRLSLDSDTLYVAGAFTAIDGISRSRVAALNTTEKRVRGWRPMVSDDVLAIVPTPGGVFLGGTFNSIGGENRKCLAQLDLKTGKATPWDPQVDGRTSNLQLVGDTVFIAGDFKNVGGNSRKYLAAVGATDASLRPFEFNLPSIPYEISMAHAADTVFFTAKYSSESGNASVILAVDANTYAVRSWDTEMQGEIIAMTAMGQTVYVGGTFHTFLGEARSRLAAFDATSGQLLPWAPEPNVYDWPECRITALCATPETVYVSGLFEYIGGENRDNLAAIDVDTGLASSWDPVLAGWWNGDEEGLGVPVPAIAAMASLGDMLYVGGEFPNIGGVYRNPLTSISKLTGEVAPWDSRVAEFGRITDIELADEKLVAAGYIYRIGTQHRSNIATVNLADKAQSADSNFDFRISLDELLRVIQFYNALGYQCIFAGDNTEDGYTLGSELHESCGPHDTDYLPQDWTISLDELLRVIQLYNSLAYHYCPDDATEDGFCPGPA